LHGKPPAVLVPREFFCGYSFSPDGKQFAYSTPGDLTVLELSTQKTHSFKVKDVNPQWNVCFMKPHWRPDGKALAVNFGFLGSVMLGPNGEEPLIPGTDHVAILPLDGSPITSFVVGKGARLLGWCDPRGSLPEPENAPLPIIQKKTWWLILHGGVQGYAVRSDGGEVRKIPPFGIGAEPNVVKSPDGKRQASVVNDGGKSQIFDHVLATGQRTRV